ncbi:uncharacterized protein LOC120137799 [Hibiscus syriacus]|uniref:uncharacterized protein LOC120137799 n=1 Tax=Hibiscus syriacus TaxID=106335 RepID=UPI001921552D|nr:uncharacterized protein LOC120137799 [Hibiscus syriacus]
MELPPIFINWIKACYSEARYSISFNGSLNGYFKGARGIRQGDLLSPLLFALSMNVLSRLLNLAAARGMFGFHPKCKKIGLTHLMFADDLLIFCKGIVESVIGVIGVLDKFYEMSGLQLNAAKCEFYAAGIPINTIETIHRITGFTHGSLPVRYLGVPLVKRKLSEKDCVLLIEKIKAKLHHWSGKHLSYAGRLELIRAVLFSVANYWCRQLFLPQSIINKIEQLCSCFLWKGSDKAATGVRVSWRLICNSKSEGGLSLKDLKTWNKACMLQLIRNILAGEGSLWVAWIKSYLLKDRDFWHTEGGTNASWSFRKLLKLKIEAQTVFSTGAKTTRAIWDEIRVKRDKVTWHNLIWFPLHIPKHSMIAWMTILDRLPTKNRLQQMGIITDGWCVLCNEDRETRDHLFLECPLAVSLWQAILQLSGLRLPSLFWNTFLASTSHTWKGKSLLITILKLAWCAFLYSIWEERNRRLFKGISRNATEILKAIKEIVGIQLRGRNINRLDSVNITLCKNLNIE